MPALPTGLDAAARSRANKDAYSLVAILEELTMPDPTSFEEWWNTKYGADHFLINTGRDAWNAALRMAAGVCREMSESSTSECDNEDGVCMTPSFRLKDCAQAIEARIKE
jgi:hypothetical protein